MGRYNFYDIFYFDPNTRLLSPKFHIYVNGLTFPPGMQIQPGLTFGGINLYNFLGKDVAGRWDNMTKTLTFMGFYS